MIQKEEEMSVVITLTMLALYNPSQVLLRQRHRQPSIMRQRKTRRPSNATSVMNVHSNTCLWRSPDNILLRLLELIQVATWMSSRRQSVVARTYHQSAHSFLTHERMFLWKGRRFREKMSRPERDSNPPTFEFMPNALTTWAIRARHLLSHVFEYSLWRYRYF